MRHLAITGMETVAMISRIFLGLAMRATPPSARICAGTRSRAMTEVAPAFSAISACLASVTSMMTPPFSISARPVFKRRLVELPLFSDIYGYPVDTLIAKDGRLGAWNFLFYRNRGVQTGNSWFNRLEGRIYANEGGHCMPRYVFSVLILLLIATAGFGQTTLPTDSQTLQALLAEVRQLRRDLQASNATTERIQIALYRLQQQGQAVARAKENLSDVRKKLAELQSHKSDLTIHIEQMRTAANHSDNPQEQNHFDEVMLPALKAQLEMLEKQERETRTRENEAE